MKRKDTGKINRFLLVTFVLLVVGISVAGFAFQSLQKKHLRDIKLGEVTAIADLKGSTLESWREEQKNNVRVVTRNSFSAGAVRAFFKDPGNQNLRSRLELWLQKYCGDYGYQKVMLLDPQGRVALSFPRNGNIAPETLKELLGATSDTDAHFTSFHRDVKNEVTVAVFIRIPDARPAAPPIGFFVVEIDPSKFLYPYIQHWPIPSRTAETLLVERRENDVLFLNEPRHQRRPPLTMRHPLTNKNLPAVHAASQKTGTMEGFDYRGVPVLAAYRPVFGSPWGLVSKIDQTEVYRPLRMTTLLVGSVTLTLIITAGAAVINVARRHDMKALEERDREREKLLRSERRAAETVRESEERFRAIFDNAGVGIVEVMGDDRFIAVNDRICEILGYSREEMLQMNVAELTAPADRPLSDAMNRQVREKRGGRVAYDKRYLKRDGTPLWVHVNVSGVYDADGQWLRSVTTVEDISGRKAAEEALRKSKEQLEELAKLLEYAPVLVRNMHGEITIWNTGMETMYGFSAGEAVGKISHALLHTAFPQPLEEITTTLLAEGKWQGELRHRTLDGNEITVASLWVLHQAPEGREPAIIEVYSDITRRKEAEEKLRKSEEQFRQLAEALPQFVWMAHPDGGNEYFNMRWFEYTGATPEESQGLQWTKFVHPEDYAHTTTRWHHSILTGAPHEVEHRFRRADGEYHWFVSRGLPVCDDNGRIARWFGTSTDIQDQRRAQEAAEAAARAKTDFMANMSHEIRTPMNGILGITDLLQDTSLDPLQRRYLDMVKSSGEALLTVVNDVLDFSKLEAGGMAVDSIAFDLHDVVEKVAENLSICAFQKGVELTVDVAPEIPLRFLGDPGKLRQVLLNVIGNAVKFTEKGEVKVRVQGGPTEAPRWELSFSVTDTGIGIPEDKLAMIFESFTQVDTTISRTYGGTGLGLAISKRIVERMGGRIRGESRVGKGSTFDFEVELPQAGTSGNEEPLPTVGIAGLHALIVDDNATSRTLLQRSLAAKGLVVESAATGTEAIRMAVEAADSGKPFDLIFLDMHLTDLHGLQVADRIRERYRIDEACIMMITPDDIAGGARRAREVGVASYLVKPIRTVALHQALARLHQAPGKTAAETTVPAAAVSAPLCIRVLLAEDNQVNMTVTATILRKAGVRVTPAANGAEAVEAFERGLFHLILMDVQMPQMDGFEATRLIREKDAAIPIIGLTAHALEADRDRCLAAGMDDYLPKPVTSSLLIEKVEKWAQQHPLPAAEPEKLLQQLGGDRAAFESVIRTFTENAPLQLAEVTAAVTAGEADRVEKAAHKLKGTVAVMAAETARCLAETLEKSGKERNLSGAGEVLARLQAEFARVLAELSHCTT